MQDVIDHPWMRGEAVEAEVPSISQNEAQEARHKLACIAAEFFLLMDKDQSREIDPSELKSVHPLLAKIQLIDQKQNGKIDEQELAEFLSQMAATRGIKKATYFASEVLELAIAVAAKEGRHEAIAHAKAVVQNIQGEYLASLDQIVVKAIGEASPTSPCPDTPKLLEEVTDYECQLQFTPSTLSVNTVISAITKNPAEGGADADVEELSIPKTWLVRTRKKDKKSRAATVMDFLYEHKAALSSQVDKASENDLGPASFCKTFMHDTISEWLEIGIISVEEVEAIIQKHRAQVQLDEWLASGMLSPQEVAGSLEKHANTTGVSSKKSS